MAATRGWQRALLQAIGAPATANNIKFLNAWQRAEGGGAKFNPLNTTQHAQGATNFNRFGVKNYTSFQQGIQATAQTLLNGRYNNIVQGLRTGSTAPMALARAEAATPWGTGALIQQVLGGPVSSYGAPAPSGGGSMDIGTGNVTTQVPKNQQQPAENTHRYSDFAMSLIHALQSHDSNAMLGAIMNLRRSLAKPEPVSQPIGATVGGPAAGTNNPLKNPLGPATQGMKPYQEMIYAQNLAKKMGLRITENYDLPGGVNPVHVPHSYHYRRYSGDPKLGRATDVSGSPAQMAAYYRALAKTNPTELFYDPLGGIKYGKQIGSIGGHRDHVHIAY